MGDNFLQEFSLAMRSKGPSCQLEQLLLQGMQFGIGGAAAIGTFLTTNALLQVASVLLSSCCLLVSPTRIAGARRQRLRTAGFLVLVHCPWHHQTRKNPIHRPARQSSRCIV
jgi:hypothetical protein